MENKIRIKLGSLEIEFEGDLNYLKNDLPSLIDKLSNLNIPAEHHDNQYTNSTVNEISINNIEVPIPQMSSNTISAKLNVKSASDLIIAACAHLTLIQNKSTFNRNDILNEMKNATNYYKDTVSKNLSNSLKTLTTNQKLMERSNGVYALSAQELARVTPMLNGN